MVQRFAEVVKFLLLGAPVGAGRSSGVGVQGALHALVTTVLWRFTGFDELR
jgi:hypothetical protein